MNDFLKLRSTPIAPSYVLYHSPPRWLSSNTESGHPLIHPCTSISSLQNSIVIGSLSVSHVTTGIRANNPRTSTMPPETRATDLKHIEDSMVVVSQDHNQKYELLVDMFKGQTLKLDQTIENQGGRLRT